MMLDDSVSAPLMGKDRTHIHTSKTLNSSTYWLLYVTLGWLGAHRLALGHFRLSMMMFLSFGFGLCGWISDCVLVSRYIREVKSPDPYIICSVASSVRISQKDDTELSIGFPSYTANFFLYLSVMCGLLMVGFLPSVWNAVHDYSALMLCSFVYVWVVSCTWARFLYKVCSRISKSRIKKNAFIIGSGVLYFVWLFGIYHHSIQFTPKLVVSLPVQGAALIGAVFLWSFVGMCFSTDLVNFRFLKVESGGKSGQVKLVIIKQGTSLNPFMPSHSRVREYALTKDLTFHLTTVVRQSYNEYDGSERQTSFNVYSSHFPNENLLSRETDQYDTLVTHGQWEVVCDWIGCKFDHEKMFVPNNYECAEASLDIKEVSIESDTAKQIQKDFHDRCAAEKQVFLNPQKISQVFGRIDINGDGIIDKSELRAMMAAFGTIVTDSTMNCLFQEIDTSKNGKIHLNEFANYFRLRAHKKEGPLMDLFPLLCFDEEVQYAGVKLPVGYNTAENLTFVQNEMAFAALIQFYPYGKRYSDVHDFIFNNDHAHIVLYSIKEKNIEDADDKDEYFVWGMWGHGELYACAFHSTSAVPVAQIFQNVPKIVNPKMLDDPVSFYHNLFRIVEKRTNW